MSSGESRVQRRVHPGMNWRVVGGLALVVGGVGCNGGASNPSSETVPASRASDADAGAAVDVDGGAPSRNVGEVTISGIFSEDETNLGGGGFFHTNARALREITSNRTCTIDRVEGECRLLKDCVEKEGFIDKRIESELPHPSKIVVSMTGGPTLSLLPTEKGAMLSVNDPWVKGFAGATLHVVSEGGNVPVFDTTLRAPTALRAFSSIFISPGASLDRAAGHTFSWAGGDGVEAVTRVTLGQQEGAVITCSSTQHEVRMPASLLLELEPGPAYLDLRAATKVVVTTGDWDITVIADGIPSRVLGPVTLK